ALQRGAWGELWRPAAPAARAGLPAAAAEEGSLHVFAKFGQLTIGALQQVRKCPSMGDGPE
ncbi:unnamed protein product, partial [Prorocentrum cordatum]